MCSDTSPSASHALLLNTRPLHCFTDMARVSNGAKEYCCRHDAVCLPPKLEQDIFVCGFCCKANSLQNPARTSTDPLKSVHFETFEYALSHIQTHRPRTFVLENVATGLQAPRSKEDPRPLLTVLVELMRSKLPFEYSLGHLEVTAHPLPTKRPRIYFIGSRVGDVAPAILQIKQLQSFVEQLPAHSFKCFLAPPDMRMDAGLAVAADASESQSLNDNQAYFQALSKAWQQAVDYKKVDPKAHLPPLHLRASAQAGPGLTAREKAGLDLCEHMCRAKFQQEGMANAVADISQSTYRANLHGNGSLPTITTSSKVYVFAENRVMDPIELMRAHGFFHYSFLGLRATQATSLVGNMMAGTSLALVYIGVLQLLGRLQRIP